MLLKKRFIVLFFLLTISVFPQGEAALPSLLLPTSPTLTGAGATGTASLIDDPYKVYFNPAHLGQSSLKSGFSTGFYPGKINWLNFNAISLNSYIFSQGINLEKIFNGVPFSVGFSYSKTEMDFTSLGGGVDYSSSYSLGIGYHSFIDVNFGFTIKDVTSSLENQSFLNPTVNTTATDYGILVNVPLNNFINKYLRYNIPPSSSIQADINYTLGYSIQNIADEIHYVDIGQPDPIGRTARLAHSINFGINLETTTQTMNLVNFFYSIDAEDILIKTKIDTLTAINNFEYEGLFGTIKPVKNLFLGKHDPEIVLHKGLTVEFLESFYFAWGGLDGRGFDNRKTTGFGIRTKGILKLINYSEQSAVLKYITDHFDIQYSSAYYFAGHPLETEFQGVTISVTGF